MADAGCVIVNDVSLLNQMSFNRMNAAVGILEYQIIRDIRCKYKFTRAEEL